MEVNLRPKNFKLTGDVEEHIRSRVERLVRALESVQSSEVILNQGPTHLSPNRVQYRVQMTIHLANDIIRAEVENFELLTAVDQALDRLSRQIERYRARHEKKRRASIGLGKASAATLESDGAQQDGAAGDAPAEEESGGSIVRVKSFSFAPMFPEDAVDQMEMLGHSFFVFWNATDERVNVLYKRTDGNYGLIQPDFS
ncbi:MAG TPA: ribosome-associated translation inhibitor RaiA [Chloroflexia bacterium]|nr:ribosome-associated translation inhibitor RaiA [Chloroflexia bacterium]